MACPSYYGIVSMVRGWRKQWFDLPVQSDFNEFAKSIVRPVNASQSGNIAINCVPHRAWNLPPNLSFSSQISPFCKVCCHDWLFFKCVSYRYKSRRDSDIPRLVAFPEQDVLHICTSIKDRVATVWMWQTGTSVSMTVWDTFHMARQVSWGQISLVDSEMPPQPFHGAEATGFHRVWKGLECGWET